MMVGKHNKPPRGADHSRALVADLTLVLVTVFWGVSFTVVKTTLEAADPSLLVALRFGLSVVMLLPVAFVRRSAFRPDILLPGLVCGLFLFAALYFQSVGLVYTTASRSGFITGLNVILVPIFSALLLKRPPARAAAVGAVLALVGLYLLALIDSGQGVGFNRGDVLTLGCAAAAAGHILAVGYFAPGRDALWLTLIQLAAAGLLSWLWTGISAPTGQTITGPLLAAAAFLALTCTVFAFWAQAWAQRITTPTRTAVIYTLEPVFSAVIAWFWLGERLGGWGLAGAGLILAGVLVAELKPAAWGRAQAAPLPAAD